jgi:hypothetical protein
MAKPAMKNAIRVECASADPGLWFDVVKMVMYWPRSVTGEPRSVKLPGGDLQVHDHCPAFYAQRRHIRSTQLR